MLRIAGLKFGAWGGRKDDGPDVSDIRELAALSTSLHKCFVLRPEADPSKAFEWEIDSMVTRIADEGLEPAYKAMAKQLQTKVEEFTDYQRQEVDETVGVLSGALTEMLDKFTTTVERQDERLSEVERVRGSLAKASSADTLEQTRTLLSASLESMQRMVEREMSVQTEMRRDQEDYTVRLRAKVEVLEKESRTDALTGLGNRTAFKKHVQSVLDHLRITTGSYSLALVDLDDFRKVNEVYGHCAGDTALTVFAQRLQAAVGKQPFVGRWGGDEFVVVAPTRPEILERMLHRLNEQLETYPIGHEGISLHVSATFGVQPFVKSSTAEEVVQRADAMLYEARRARAKRSAA